MEKEALLQILAKQGITEKTLKAIETVPREEFTANNPADAVYQNIALPVDYNQTISQPYTVAYMIDLLDPQPGQRILELGGGTGYSAAVLWERIEKKGEIYSLEIIAGLHRIGKENLHRAGYDSINFICKDGKTGYPEKAPYDRIIITAAVKKLRQEILNQLKPDAILIYPAEISSGTCIMTKIKKHNNKITTSTHGYFAFVPFV